MLDGQGRDAIVERLDRLAHCYGPPSESWDRHVREEAAELAEAVAAISASGAGDVEAADALEDLYDAIRPRDGSMPDRDRLEVVAERCWPILRAALSGAGGEQDGGGSMGSSEALGIKPGGFFSRLIEGGR